jgi:hypothetical protein
VEPPAPPFDPGPSPEPPAPTEPVPGGRRVIRVTDPSDGRLINRGYAYHSQVFYREQTGSAFLFAGHEGGMPRFFEVHLASGAVSRLGSLINFVSEGEGWYWDRHGFVYLHSGPRLHRINPFAVHDDTVVMDISATHPGCRLWQCHSSDDGRAHSGTVQRIVADGPYVKLGTVVQLPDRQEFFGAEGDLDESHISACGLFVVIEEGHNNRIYNFETGGGPTRISNAEGALAHIDMGHGFMVGEDDQRGACTWINLRNIHERRVLHETWGMGHVSVRNGRCLLSNDSGIYLVPMDGSRQLEKVADHGMVGSGYDYQVHANLDPTGRLGAWLSNHGSDRLDLDLMVL